MQHHHNNVTLSLSRATTMLTPLASLSILYPKHLQGVASIAEKAMSYQKCDSILIHSGAPKLSFLDDYHHPYKANPHFTWWLPITQSPHCYLLIQTGQKPVLFYHLADDFWHVPPQPPQGFWCDYFDIHLCADLAQVKRGLRQFQSTNENRAWIGEDIELAKELGILQANPEGLMHQLHYARAVKSQYELACLTQANVAAFAGHQGAKQAFMAGKSELDTQLAYLCAAQQDTLQMPYRNIVAFGHHSAILHYQHYDHSPQNMNQPQSFLIDAGASFNGYAADVTRCHSRGSVLYKELTQAMTQAQAKICAMAKPGVSFVDLHLQMHQRVLDILIDFNLVQGSKDELITSHVSSAFFPHGLGHLLGLQVHDIGGWQQDELGTMLSPPKQHRFLRCTKTLEQNMVITIEPGLYIIDSLLEKWKKSGFAHLLNTTAIDHLRPLGGVRMEDNIVVAQTPVRLSL
ncbi:Xaa-Pro dipeptidase [Oceanospirillaceae bacterium]|nr:Xaa-Pro dipeptidase [Oceanospirillaceae bacterium]